MFGFGDIVVHFHRENVNQLQKYLLKGCPGVRVHFEMNDLNMDVNNLENKLFLYSYHQDFMNGFCACSLT